MNAVNEFDSEEEDRRMQENEYLLESLRRQAIPQRFTQTSFNPAQQLWQPQRYQYPYEIRHQEESTALPLTADTQETSSLTQETQVEQSINKDVKNKRGRKDISHEKNWASEETEKLINLWADKPVLYNSKLPEYINK